MKIVFRTSKQFSEPDFLDMIFASCAFDIYYNVVKRILTNTHRTGSLQNPAEIVREKQP